MQRNIAHVLRCALDEHEHQSAVWLPELDRWLSYYPGEGLSLRKTLKV